MSLGSFLKNLIVFDVARYSKNSSGVITGFSDKTNIPYSIAQWGVASGIAPSGTIGNNGALTLGTALPRIFSEGIYLYFPADSIAVGVAAGSYWCVMSSTTAGTIYNNTLSGIPTTPASPTAFVTTGPGAYTGDTTARVVASFTIPAGSLGNRGVYNYKSLHSHINNANNKVHSLTFGSATLQTVTSTTSGGTLIDKPVFLVTNGIQKSTGVSVTGPGQIVSHLKHTVDTTVDVTVTHLEQITVATDYAILESAVHVIQYGA